MCAGGDDRAVAVILGRGARAGRLGHEGTTRATPRAASRDGVAVGDGRAADRDRAWSQQVDPIAAVRQPGAGGVDADAVPLNRDAVGVAAGLEVHATEGDVRSPFTQMP